AHGPTQASAAARHHRHLPAEVERGEGGGRGGRGGRGVARACHLHSSQSPSRCSYTLGAPAISARGRVAPPSYPAQRGRAQEASAGGPAGASAGHMHGPARGDGTPQPRRSHVVRPGQERVRDLLGAWPPRQPLPPPVVRGAARDPAGAGGGRTPTLLPASLRRGTG